MHTQLFKPPVLLQLCTGGVSYQDSMAVEIQDDAKCAGTSELLGEFDTLGECAGRCFETDECSSFVYGKTNNKCWREVDAACASTSHTTLASNRECRSRNSRIRGTFDTVEDCAKGCLRKHNCTFFIYGKDKKKGQCWMERFEDGHGCSKGSETSMKTNKQFDMFQMNWKKNTDYDLYMVNPNPKPGDFECLSVPGSDSESHTPHRVAEPVAPLLVAEPAPLRVAELTVAAALEQATTERRMMINVATRVPPPGFPPVRPLLPQRSETHDVPVYYANSIYLFE